MPARRWSPFTNSTPQQRPSRKPSPVRRKACPNSSRSWMSCSQAGRDTLRPTAHGRDDDDTHETRFPETATATAVLTAALPVQAKETPDRKSTRLNSSHSQISYAVFCLKKKKKRNKLHLYKTT